jgi:hypothetical protein
MDRTLRNATPLVLLVLAGLAWFEPLLPGAAWLRERLGPSGLLRFVVGLLAVYCALLVAERQRMEQVFRQVLGELQSFRGKVAGGAAAPPTQAAGAGASDMVGQQREAIRILIAALRSDERDVRQTAAQNLERLTGQQFGEDRGAWESWFADRGAAGERSAGSEA